MNGPGRNKGTRAIALVIGAIVLLAVSDAAAMTIVVRDDANMVAAADAIVHATVGDVEARLHENGRVFTHVELLVHETWKGSIPDSEIEIVEPGGVTREAMDRVPGVPPFRSGEDVVLFLVRTRSGAWSVLDFWAGAFRVLELADGRAIVSRSPHGEGLFLRGPGFEPFADGPREFAAFREWIRAREEGSSSDIRYRLTRAEIEASGGVVGPETPEDEPSRKWKLMGNSARWHVFDTGGSEAWYYGNDPQVGFNANGPAEFGRALAAWSGETVATIEMTNAGRHTPHGVGWANGTDGVSEVLFNDPYDEIDGAFSCANGGVLAFGGIHGASGQHTYRGGTWWSAVEGDVVFQNWNQDCAWLDADDLTEVIQHELGHTLGFGHSYDNGENGNALTEDALMRWFSHGGALADTLGEDDRCVAYWLYPAARVDTGLSPNSSVTVSPATVSPNGSATVTVTLSDGSGAVPGQVVRGWIETTSGSATGSLDRGTPYPDVPFEDLGDGRYTATVTAGAGDGTVRIHVRVNCCDDAIPAPPEPCDAFSPTATLTVVSGPIPGDATGDGTVDGDDLDMIVRELFDTDGTAAADRCDDPNPCPEAESDGNSDGVLDAADLAVAIKNGS